MFKKRLYILIGCCYLDVQEAVVLIDCCSLDVQEAVVLIGCFCADVQEAVVLLHDVPVSGQEVSTGRIFTPAIVIVSLISWRKLFMLLAKVLSQLSSFLRP